MKTSLSVSVLVLITTQLLIASPGFGQNEREITLTLKNESLVNALKKIEDLSGFRVAYSIKDVENYQSITLSKGTRTLGNTLKLVLNQTNLAYRVQNGSIIIYHDKIAPPINTDFNSPPPQDTIGGRIVNEKNEPIESASVMIKGTQKGTITNSQGEFVLRDVDANAIIEISAVGYLTQEMPLTGKTRIHMQLSSAVNGMEQVVVTALGITRKTKSLAYSTQTVPPSTLIEARDPNNLLNSLQGKIANALITQTSGGVGSDAKIILRGNRSLTGTSSALIVVDGIPGRIADVNPDNIESMTVLTGANGAALYGSQAGNGVIVITTKKGSRDGMTVNVNSGITFDRPFSLPFIQNEYGQGSSGQISDVGTSWGEKMNGQMYTNHFGEQVPYSAQPDNIKDFFHTGINLNNSISVTGGNEKAQTYLSYINNHVEGIIPNNVLNGHVVNLRISNQITKRFSTDAKLTYNYRKIEGAPKSGEVNTPVMDIYQIPRSLSTEIAKHYQDISNEGIPVPAPWPSTNQGSYGNPYWEVNNDILDETRNNVVGFLKAKYKITDWLSIIGSANLDLFNEKLEQKTYENTLVWARNPGGYYSIGSTNNTQKWFDVMLEGSNNISEDLNLRYHAGAIYRDLKSDNFTTIGDGLLVANKFSINYASEPYSTQSSSQVQTQSVFAIANLSYKDYLFVDATFRNDWDSRLPEPHAYQYYSFGVSSVLTDFMKIGNIDFLKTYLSYAEVGNGGQFGLLTTPYRFVAGAGDGYLVRSSTLPFPDLKPEIVRNIEAGVDLRLLNNRLGINVGVYKSNSFNQLFRLSIPVATGYSEYYLNAGNIQNQGFELIVNAGVVRNSKFTWDVAFNLGMNKNKVKELTDQITEFTFGPTDYGAAPIIRVGGSFGDLVGLRWEQNEKGEYLVDEEGRPITSDKLGKVPSLIGDFNPRARLGLTNSFTYGNLSLRLLVDGRIGGIMVSGQEMNLAYSGIPEVTAQYRDGGLSLGGVDMEGNPISNTITSQQFWQSVSYQRQGVGEFFTYDATNFRIRELTLGYTIPVKPSFVKAARVSVIARNLMWLYRGSSKLDIPGIKKRKMWMDPDMSLGNENAYLGVEYGVFPSTRSLGFNLQLTF